VRQDFQLKRVIADERLKRKEKIFDALEWLAAMCSHVPNRGEQMARYYGYYSNLCRGKREKQNNDDDIPSIAVNTKSASLNKFQYLQSLDYDK
jgi:hypothetical protein